MLRVVAHTSAAAAHQYYAEGLKREDYYSEGQEIIGKWHGKAARMLGLSGDVLPDQFAALVENRNPATGGKLTPRTNAERRVGYDLNFHAPKSLSVLYAITQDKAVLGAFRKAVAETMSELEELAETRVRKRGAQGSRITGNLAWAEFVHFTARPVGGIPDPHLHVHAFTFNATFDALEDRWKAAEFGGIKREAHYAEAAFHARLAAALEKQGYGIRRTKNGWEIDGIPQSVIAKFSRRTAQIDRRAEELGIKNARQKDTLGAATREGKRHGMSFAELLAAWGAWLTDEEKAQLSKACYDKSGKAKAKITAAETLDYALAKNFERQSVARRGHILASALRHGVGQVSPAEVKAEFTRRQLIGRKIGDEHLCTSVDVLAEEIAMLAFVRSGRNSAMAIGGKRPRFAAHLSAEQRAAAANLLTSRDQVMVVRGSAGAGKTTMMVEACAAIERQGLKVFAFAPSASASRGTLREAGFVNAETIAHLLASEELQRQVRGQVIWIDEAGTVGVRDMLRIFEVVGPDTRIILTGDTAQHAPVPRGDALQLMQKYAGLRIAHLQENRRQLVEGYRDAINALSKGDLRKGFRQLEQLGAFVEIADPQERYRELAADYVALGKRGQFPLVVSPTHKESREVTEAIRTARREAGQLGEDRKFVQYSNLQWEEVERGIAGNYVPGLLVQFHQNVKGIGRGEMLRVVRSSVDGGVEVQNSAGRLLPLPLKECSKFLVYEEREIALAQGDRIRITRNGKSQNGRRLDNGMEFTIEKFGRKGEIILKGGAVLDAGHGHFAYGYCQTSHSAQSKSVRDVLVAQGANSLVASSSEQFYVSASRGKETIRIYTDSRQQLQEAVGNSSARMPAMELAGITEKDLSSFMSGLGAQQWREHVAKTRVPHGPAKREEIKSRLAKDGSSEFRRHIASRRGLDGAKKFVENLSEQRKTQPRKTGEKTEWQGYVEMRRNIAGADGKNRSKGYNTQVSKGRAQQSKGKTLPKTSQHSQQFLKENAQRHEAAKKAAARPEKKPAPAKTRLQRLTDAYRSAAKHFRKVADKVKGTRKEASGGRKVNMGGKAFSPQTKGSAERAAKHAAREMEPKRKNTGDGARKAKEMGRQPVRAPIVKK